MCCMCFRTAKKPSGARYEGHVLSVLLAGLRFRGLTCRPPIPRAYLPAFDSEGQTVVHVLNASRKYKGL